MTRTIDLGIDLGTTNSVVARHCEGRTVLVANPTDASVLLPSVVHVHADGRIAVGSAARALQAVDPLNTAAEFKRLMGTSEQHTFSGSGRRLSAEALSAEVLRELVRWVTAHGAATPEAAVITVPAMFQLPQCDATRRAAQSAGLQHTLLLQEPIAAALSQAGSGELSDGHWMIYDLGGGTFDVSLVRSRGGRLQVIDHDGDNHLGGKDFDRMLARKAADVVREDGLLGEFRRSDPAFAPAFALLRVEAERVRLALSTREKESFRVDSLAITPAGQPVGVAFTVTRDLLEQLLYPLILRTTALCKRVLERNDLRRAPVRGLVLVGGPTRTPLLAKVLADELGIEPRASDDSMTIVARGAALYAATQKLPSTARRRTPGEVARLELLLEYEAMTTNPRPLIVGKVDPGLVPAGSVVTIATDGDDTPTPAPVRADGTFHVEVALVPGGANRLHVRVMGPRGDHLPAEPVTLTIVHGVSMARPPLSQSVGVMLADNTVCVYLAKGTVLPARRTLIHVTTRTIRRGQSGEAISVPLIQGESGKGDRNKVIGVLRIFAFNLKRDLPSGTEVAVTLTIDEFSQTQARAYVPMLDQSFDEVVSFDLETKTAGVVHEHLEAQRARLAALEAVSLDGADEAAVDPRVQEVEALLDEGDRDSVDLADHLLRALAEELDDMDGAHAKKSLRTELEGGLARTEDLVTKLGKAEDITLLRALSGEVRHALTRGEFDLAKTRYNEAEQLHLMVLMRHHEFWHNLFERFSAHITAYGLEEAARTPLASGRRAIADRSTSQLVEACRELQKLLPRHIQDQQQALGMRLMSHIR